MISSKDFEKLWFLYQTEGAPKGVSINSFCIQSGIPYNEFEKWYKKTRRSVVPVEVVGMPETSTSTPHEQNHPSCHSVSGSPVSSKGNILVTIKTRDGLHISKGDLDYTGLKLLVERLEGLC